MDENHYGRPAIALHWLIFALILCGFTLAVYMTGLPLSPQKLKYISWHKWIGVTIFMLALARVAWGFTHPTPVPPALIPAWQRRTENVVHMMLYVLIITIPLTGWLMSSAFGVPTVYLGLARLPDLLTRDPALAELLRFVHVMLNYTLLALVIIHAAAAIKHHFYDRDDVLQRMLPFIKLLRKQ